MKRILLLCIVFSLVMSSCSSSKKIISKRAQLFTKADKIVSHAKKYTGTKYQFGGVTKKGMDCSGLIFVAYKKENILLPRVSRNMAKEGKKISLKKVTKGDLLFFRTNKNSRKINHVGLVSYVRNGTIKFLHATSSRGVIESSLSQKYWKSSFVKATKILE
jgi:cell wall-associated NlpC family hydrolase